MMTYTIEKISLESAEHLCRKITKDLPEYFGLPEANEHYHYNRIKPGELVCLDDDLVLWLIKKLERNNAKI